MEQQGNGPKPTGQAQDRLGSWKEIAAYLRTAERTVQRWETEEGLPIHRLTHRKRSTVFAYKSEIETWLDERSSKAQVVPPAHAPAQQAESIEPAPAPVKREAPAPTQSAPNRKPWVAIAAVAAIAALGFSLWNRGEGPSVQAPPPAATPLTDLAGQEITPALSPDGSQVAFAWRKGEGSNFDIYVMDVPGGEPRRFTSGSGDELSPAWSPDGTRISFVEAEAGRGVSGGTSYSLIVASTEGDEQQVIREGRQPQALFPWFGSWFAWHPDGKHIAAQGGIGGEPGGLFLIAADGSSMDRLTTGENQAGGDMAPAFSPDGSMMAFLRRHNSMGSEVFVKKLGSDEPSVRLTHWNVWASSPKFSPDGTEIWVTAGDVSVGRRLWSLDPENNREPRLLSASGDRGHELSVAPSPNGDARVVYSQGIFRTDIWAVDLETLEERPLIASQFQDATPDISSKGRVAFVSDRSGKMEIWLANPDGNEQKQLTTDLGTVTSPPTWSPDENHLAIAVLGKSGTSLVRVDAKTGEASIIETGIDHHQAPYWSPMGDEIYFRARFEGRMQRVYKVAAEGGQADFASPPRFQGIRISLDGKRLFASRSNRRLQERLADGKTQTLAQLHHGASFDLSQRAVHYMARTDRRETGMIGMVDLETGETREQLAVSLPWLGLVAFPDGKRVLYTKVAEQEVDLMLVDGVR